MDSGSFVLERDGVRWVIDPKVPSYGVIEAAGVHFWGHDQQAERWKIFEAGPFSHSTLTIDGDLHTAQASAQFTSFSEGSEPSATVDLGTTLGLQNGDAERTFRLLPERRLEMTDRLRGLRPESTIRWAITTPAEVAVDGHTAILTKDGKSLSARIISPEKITLRIEELTADDPPWRRPIPGVRMLIADVPVPESGELTIVAEFGNP